MNGGTHPQVAMNLRDDPHAQALLADAELPAEAIRSCFDHLCQRSLSHFRRAPPCIHALSVRSGKLTGSVE